MLCVLFSWLVCCVFGFGVRLIVLGLRMPWVCLFGLLVVGVLLSCLVGYCLYVMSWGWSFRFVWWFACGLCWLIRLMFGFGVGLLIWLMCSCVCCGGLLACLIVLVCLLFVFACGAGVLLDCVCVCYFFAGCLPIWCLVALFGLFLLTVGWCYGVIACLAVYFDSWWL